MLLGPIRFTNALAGTPDFIYPGPAIDMQSPAAAGAANGTTYVYYAQSLDMSEWEIGSGAYTSGSGTFARTTIMANSLGTTAKINFTNPPQIIVFDTATAFLTQATADLRYAFKRNRIINGGVQVSQENGAAAGTTDAYYPVDQFFSGLNGATVSIQQVASPTPGGSPNRLRVTVTAALASPAAGNYLLIAQHIEGDRIADLKLGTAAAKTMILQFGCKGPAGTYSVVFENGAGNRSYVAEYVISGPEANTEVVKSVTVPGDITGAWLTDNSLGLRVRFCLMTGSTFAQAPNAWQATDKVGSTNQFNFTGTNGNVFELFDVGLYDGVSAPPFQLTDFVSELALCMRYWEKSYDYGTAVATATQAGAALFYSNATSGVVSLLLNFKVEKRATPTMAFYSPFNGAAGVWLDDQGTPTNLSVTTKALGTKSAAGYTFLSSANPRLVGHWTANARL